MLENRELTFAAVDDLVAAFVRGKLKLPRQDFQFVPKQICPFVEIFLQSKSGRFGPIHSNDWLEQYSLTGFRNAVLRTEPSWIDNNKQRGLLRTVFDPLSDQPDPVRTAFLIAARKAAENAGFSVATSQGLAAAMRELESNVHEHSERHESGIIAFQQLGNVFEFVVADLGIGVLATMRQAPEFSTLADHGKAIRSALEEGASRHGRTANRGMGFRDLFRSLVDMSAEMRFRSGDHALTISGASPTLKIARLDQKEFFQGFLIAVRCELGSSGLSLH